MSEDSTFGSEPEQLKRLLAISIEMQMPAEDLRGPDPLDVLLEKPGATIGRYELLEVLGEGGMGVVYLARQREPICRKVALKIIKPGMDSRRVLARFEIEQQALALMDHPYVARVYDGGLTTSGRPYFVMEYVNGVPITDYCDGHRLSVEGRLTLFLNVCEAVQHAHQKGIIHRDLKPSNILVVTDGANALPKVIDFGVARALSRPLNELTLTTGPAYPIGTPEYMSPEQANPGNPDIDIRSDVYTLGVLLYKLLSGLLPFDSGLLRDGGLEGFRRVIAEQEPHPPSVALKAATQERQSRIGQCRGTDTRTLERELAGDLDWITFRAIEKNRDRRYATVDALAQDICRHLKHEVISAAPPGLWYRTRKLLRRHRVATAAFCALLLLVAGAALSAVMYKKAADAERYAETLGHGQVLSHAQGLYRDRQFEQARSGLHEILWSKHVGREARLLFARASLELEKTAEALAQLETLVGREDVIAGQAHFLLAKLYDETGPSDPALQRTYAERREFHRRQAERLVPAIAQYYFLRKQVSLANQEQLDLLRRSVRLDGAAIFGKPVNAGPTINGSHMDILPFISADNLSLYFTSDRPGGQGKWDIWVATRDHEDAPWSEPANLGPPVNTPDFEGFASVSADGLELYFSRGIENHGDMYVAARDSRQRPWRTPAALPVNINTTTTEDWGPLISFDGLTLYFISNRPDGVGSLDIWMVQRPEPHGPWTECPLPLSPPVNSPHVEGRKCLSADERVLFFQRIRGEENVDGRQAYDESLYAVTRETKTDPWSEPIDLGSALEGSEIPFIYSLSSDGSHLYFCDHPWTKPRPGGFGTCDIWYLPIAASEEERAQK